MSRLTRDGTAEPVSRDQILRHERGQGNIPFSFFSVDHVQDWQPYPVDPYSCYMRVTILSHSSSIYGLYFQFVYNVIHDIIILDRKFSYSHYDVQTA